jgi:hypothetical protein
VAIFELAFGNGAIAEKTGRNGVFAAQMEEVAMKPASNVN